MGPHPLRRLPVPLFSFRPARRRRPSSPSPTASRRLIRRHRPRQPSPCRGRSPAMRDSDYLATSTSGPVQLPGGTSSCVCPPASALFIGLEVDGAPAGLGETPFFLRAGDDVIHDAPLMLGAFHVRARRQPSSPAGPRRRVRLVFAVYGQAADDGAATSAASCTGSPTRGRVARRHYWVRFRNTTLSPPSKAYKPSRRARLSARVPSSDRPSRFALAVRRHAGPRLRRHVAACRPRRPRTSTRDRDRYATTAPPRHRGLTSSARFNAVIFGNPPQSCPASSTGRRAAPSPWRAWFASATRDYRGNVHEILEVESSSTTAPCFLTATRAERRIFIRARTPGRSRTTRAVSGVAHKTTRRAARQETAPASGVYATQLRPAGRAGARPGNGHPSARRRGDDQTTVAISWTSSFEDVAAFGRGSR